MNAINEKIKELRVKSGIKQADVARSAGIKQSSYASIEKGDTKSISIEVGKGIAKALEVSFNELFDIKFPVEIDKLQEKISVLEKIISEQKELLSILQDQNNLLKPYRQAYIQELTIGETMILITEKIIREALQKGEDYTITSNEIRKEALEYLKKEFPHLNLQEHYFISPNELNK